MSVHNEVIFSDVDNFIVIIDTDEYSGNFERELAAFVAGAYSEEMYHGRAQLEIFMDDADGDDHLTGIMSAVKSQRSDEFTGIEVVEAIWPTPGRFKDMRVSGDGRHYDAAPGELGFPAYESVAIFFSRPLTELELGTIRVRSEQFAENYSPPFKIKCIRQEIIRG